MPGRFLTDSPVTKVAEEPAVASVETLIQATVLTLRVPRSASRCNKAETAHRPARSAGSKQKWGSRTKKDALSKVSRRVKRRNAWLEFQKRAIASTGEGRRGGETIQWRRQLLAPEREDTRGHERIVENNLRVGGREEIAATSR